MMKLLLAVSFTLVAYCAIGQNVGQEENSLLNYVDINGLKQGDWNKTYSNGVMEYETYFIDNKPVGDFKKYDKFGNLFAYLIHDTLTDFARAKFYHRSGKIISEGNYLGKNRDSTWNYYSSNGILYLQESYKNGIKDGVCRRYTKEKVLIEESYWKDSVKDGSWKKFYSSGELMWESNFENGLLEGEAKSWYKNGKIYREGTFKNDLMEGPWFKYSDKGGVEKIYHYKGGFSLEAEEESNEVMKELHDNKGKFYGPEGANDIDWLRGKSKY